MDTQWHILLQPSYIIFIICQTSYILYKMKLTSGSLYPHCPIKASQDVPQCLYQLISVKIATVYTPWKNSFWVSKQVLPTLNQDTRSHVIQSIQTFRCVRYDTTCYLHKLILMIFSPLYICTMFTPYFKGRFYGT